MVALLDNTVLSKFTSVVRGDLVRQALGQEIVAGIAIGTFV